MKKLMDNKNEFFEKTKRKGPSFVTIEFLRLGINPGNAIELGCGAGRDTIALINNNWKVRAIDKENVENIIKERLTDEQLKNLKFEVQEFENLSICKTDLIIANNSLSFCNKEYFGKLWNTISENIKSKGFFVGNFFGENDDWKKSKDEMSFFTKEDILKMFSTFKIINFKEIEKEEKTVLGNMKHWHIFEIIAQKDLHLE